MSHTITRHGADGRGEFVIAAYGRRHGTLSYTEAGADTITIDYVEVRPEWRGGGLGRRLVEAAVAWARSEQKRIVPVCPYAAWVIERGAADRDA